MKAKELATDDLLKQANLPWRPQGNNLVEIINSKGKTVVEEFYGPSREQAANERALILRAVNSFEAMRKVCLGVIHFDKHGHADTLEKAIEDAKTALALAEGKAVQS